MIGINAGIVKRGDTVVYITTDKQIHIQKAKKKEVFNLPTNTIMCFVNNELKVDFINEKIYSAPSTYYKFLRSM